MRGAPIRGEFAATALSAQTPLIVFLTEKLTAPLCFLFPKKPIGLFGDPVKSRFIRHRRRFSEDALQAFVKA